MFAIFQPEMFAIFQKMFAIFQPEMLAIFQKMLAIFQPEMLAIFQPEMLAIYENVVCLGEGYGVYQTEGHTDTMLCGMQTVDYDKLKLQMTVDIKYVF